jgi:hypothetical protein
MLIKQLSTSFEIGCLNILIDLLSDSRLFQSFIRWCFLSFFPMVVEYREEFNLPNAIRWSIIGLCAGIISGFVLTLV